jgi:uroporphyrinogen-III synthase
MKRRKAALRLPSFHRSSDARLPMPQTGLEGMRVLALEARRAKEIETLIRNHGGEPRVAPAVREVALESNQEALAFAAALLQGQFDLVVFLTGVGVRALVSIIERKYDREAFLESLRRCTVAARGPKSLSALKELKVPVAIVAPEPSTWRELMASIENQLGPRMDGLRVAVQQYGVASTELLVALNALHSKVTCVPVYQWCLPEDTESLREAILAVSQGQIHMVLFMSAVQVMHLFKVAVQMGCEDKLVDGLRSTVVVSIGPSTTEELHRYGIVPDFVPSHPRMGVLVNEASDIAKELVQCKRAATSTPS